VIKKQARRPLRKKPELSLRARALQYLARREYSRAELHGKLSRYVITDADSDSHPVKLNTLLEDLEARDWLSDERAAKQWVHAKSNRFGMQRIVYELRQKGISEELIESALPALKEGELAAVREVWQKKFGALPLNQNAKFKQMRFMQSRGFSLGVILKMLKIESE